MIAVDTSALRAIVLNEAEAGRCMAALEAEESVPISAGTLAEAFIVSARRNIADELWTLVDGMGFQVVSITAASARRIGLAYQRWGKGLHPAGLNFGDCFAYEVAKAHDCRLLYMWETVSRRPISWHFRRGDSCI
jgi:ribonuclease VapC